MQSGKRPSWDEYFMSIAVVVSSRTSCNHVRAGSVIVLDKRIVGTGYNGAPPGIVHQCLDSGCWKEKSGEQYGKSFGSGKCIGVHGEVNALANLSRGIQAGATIYTTIFPCPACAKNLLAYSIKRVVYIKEYAGEERDLSIKLFTEAGVEIEKLSLTKERIYEIIFGRSVSTFDVFG